MSVSIERIPFRGWPNALRLGNGTVEVIATLDVGPRILSYSRAGGVNPFNIYEDQAGKSGEAQWRNRGGHRLWLAPEGPEFSYYPDNAPVAWERIGDTGARLTPTPESTTGFQKQIDIILRPDGAQVKVIHRIIRTGATPCKAAPWALSVMAQGGVAIMPQPPLGEHPRDLLPNRRLVVWPYTDLSDPRFRFRRRFITLRQDPSGTPTKLGMRSEECWAGYLIKGTLFLKQFSWQTGEEYPDDGCNLEVFTNARMLELESLGPLKLLGPGENAELVEDWELLENQPAIDTLDDASLEARFLGKPKGARA
jgi:hypothetical protein